MHFFFMVLNMALQIWRFIPLDGEYQTFNWIKDSDTTAYFA